MPDDENMAGMRWGGRLPRSSWLEVSAGVLRSNLGIIRSELPAGVGLLSVVKAEAYGHGAEVVARAAEGVGASGLAVATLDEAARLRQAGFRLPVLMLMNPLESEFEWYRELDLIASPGQLTTLEALDAFGVAGGWRPKVHLKINTGMNRYGFRWDGVSDWLPVVRRLGAVRVGGIYSHFAMSDELDKSFAELQLARFSGVLEALEAVGVGCGVRHFCNSGGFLDLPQAHHDLVRVGLLALGIYPSRVCRRLEGIAPVLSWKARIATLQPIAAGEVVGYGMRYTAESPRVIGIVPLGYADGFPRVRNEGEVLVGGCRVPLVGSVAMDALAVDVTAVRGVRVGDEVVLLGRQGDEVVGVEDLARLKRSVSYDVLAGLRGRLPRLIGA